VLDEGQPQEHYLEHYAPASNVEHPDEKRRPSDHDHDHDHDH
jgi:hypothetical protein